MVNFAIKIDNLTRDFESVRAIDALSIDVPQGNIFGFLGPNGAGKSTTINILLGLLEPTSGKVEVLGYDTSTQADVVRSLTGTVLEYPGLYEQWSAESNLEFYGRVWHITDSDRRFRIKELLTKMGLWDRREEKVVKWSKGMKQKLSLARALLHKPSLIILDEPTAGLDVMAATAIQDDLANLVHDEGITIFMATHNMTEAERLCHTVAAIRKGKLVAIGSPEDLRKKTSGFEVEIIGGGFGDDVINMMKSRNEISNMEVSENRIVIQFTKEVDTAPLVNFLVSKGVQVREIRQIKASLTKAFITLMEQDK